VSNWKHVPSEQNPPDLLSRGATAEVLGTTNTWFNGPDFLSKKPAAWPKKFLDCDEEVPPEFFDRCKTVNTISAVADCTPTECFLNQFSRLYRLKIATAWFRRFQVFLKNRMCNAHLKTPRNPLAVVELREAEVSWVKYIQQRQHFARWILGFSGDKRRIVGKTSINKLNPFLVYGTLRVGGRLEKSPLGFETKHPIILPKLSHFTHLIVRDSHVKCGHSGLNHTIAVLCQMYWVIGATATVRRIINQCNKCRLKTAKPVKQLMAELPDSRLQLGFQPFAHLGVDNFGPVMVRQRHSAVKHYGCLFTCMTTRAVHL